MPGGHRKHHRSWVFPDVFKSLSRAVGIRNTLETPAGESARTFLLVLMRLISISVLKWRSRAEYHLPCTTSALDLGLARRAHQQDSPLGVAIWYPFPL